MIQFLYPDRLLWIIAAFVILLILIKIDFVKVDDVREKLRRKSSKRMVFLLRFLAIALLIIALAVPIFNLKQHTQGGVSLTILMDNSKSFDIYDKTNVPNLIKKLGKDIPLQQIIIATEDISAIGDGILGNLGENKNILLISDGNSNFGSELSDVAFVAASLNSTINLLELTPAKTDFSVKIEGPSEVIADVINKYTLRVSNPLKQTYSIILTADNTIIKEETTDKEEIIVKQAFSQGYHRLIAKINTPDHYSENNVYYKTINAIKKPKMLFYSTKDSPMLDSLSTIYDITKGTLNRNLNDFNAVILNDIPVNLLSKNDVSKLGDYLMDGNGLAVIGGQSSFDRGNYQDSYFSTLLPVTIGTGKLEEKKELNVMVLIDVSSGSREPTKKDPHGTGALEIAKAHAVHLIQNFRPTDSIAFAAFDELVYIISPLSQMGTKDLGELESKIKKLQVSSRPSTYIDVAIGTATSLLSGLKGDKYIIFLSDGQDPNYYIKPMYKYFSVANDNNIKIIAVGTGRPNEVFRNVRNLVAFPKLIDMAENTNGLFIPPGPTASQTKLLNIEFNFKKPEDLSKEELYSLVVRNAYHFITEDLKIAASVNGYNFVLPKSSANLLVTNGVGNPLLTIWRFGLGRVAVLSTDDGSRWGAELLTEENSRLISRTMNWVIGDPDRKRDYFIHIADTTKGRPATITVRSEKLPVAKNIAFSKLDDKTYTATVTSDEIGFHEILGATYAVNSNTEYLNIGINDQLISIITSTGGKIFKLEDDKEIIKQVVSKSQRTIIEEQKLIWPFILAALILFLIEVGIRKIKERLR